MKNNKKSLVERYGIYKSPFGEDSAFNQESSLLNILKEKRKKEKAKRQQQVSTPTAVFTPNNLAGHQTEIIHLKSKYGIWTVIYKGYDGIVDSLFGNDIKMGMSIYIGFIPNDSYIQDDIEIGLVQTIRVKKSGSLYFLDEKSGNREKRSLKSGEAKTINITEDITHSDEGTHIDVFGYSTNPFYAGLSTQKGRVIPKMTPNQYTEFVRYDSPLSQSSTPRNLKIFKLITNKEPGVAAPKGKSWEGSFFRLREGWRDKEIPNDKLKLIYSQQNAKHMKVNEYIKIISEEEYKKYEASEEYKQFLKSKAHLKDKEEILFEYKHSQASETAKAGEVTYGKRKNFNEARKQRHYKADLIDNPNLLPSQDNPVMTDRPNSYQVFETSPLVIRGKTKNLYMGALTWGWICGEDGKYQLLPFKVRDEISETFKNTVKKWNKVGSPVVVPLPESK